jgi:hypothetical protein
MRAESRRPGLQYVLDGQFDVGVPQFVAKQAENNSFLINNDASFGVCLASSFLHCAECLCWRARRNLAIGGLTNRFDLGELAFDRQAESKPVLFSGDVIKNRFETKTLEPPRGSRAQVSLQIITVNDDWPAFVEFRRCFPIEVPERDVDGSGEVRFFVLFGSKDFDELCPIVY